MQFSHGLLQAMVRYQMDAKLIFFFTSFCILAACSTNQNTSGPVKLGKPISEAQVAAWNIDISESGIGLPTGSSTPKIGASIYQEKCALCHGDKGQGGVANQLVGGGALNTEKPIKTVGSFWPYTATIFDYVKRSMPHQAPQSLTNAEVYGVTAYILYMNKIIGFEDVMNAKTLPLVKMPNRDGFIRIEQ